MGIVVWQATIIWCSSFVSGGNSIEIVILDKSEDLDHDPHVVSPTKMNGSNYH